MGLVLNGLRKNRFADKVYFDHGQTIDAFIDHRVNTSKIECPAEYQRLAPVPPLALFRKSSANLR
jgi:hypothetical protein